MGAFANAASRRSRPKVTKTVRIGDEFRHSSQDSGIFIATNRQPKRAAADQSSSGAVSAVFGVFAAVVVVVGAAAAEFPSKSPDGRRAKASLIA